MPKDDGLYISHILQAAEEALDFTGKISKDDFISNRMMLLAVIRLLQEIGETAAHVSPSFQEIHPEVPWQKMVSMRNFLVHHYLKIDYDCPGNHRNRFARTC